MDELMYFIGGVLTGYLMIAVMAWQTSLTMWRNKRE